MTEPKFFSYERTDKKGRRVVVTIAKRGKEIFWIRICTYLGKNQKYREDYYKVKHLKLFQKVLEKERKDKNRSRAIQRWVAK